MTLQQTAIGDYRQNVLDLLAAHWGPRFAIHTGREYFDATTRTRVQVPAGLRMIENHFIAGRRLLWQSGAVRPLIRSHVAIMELNPRILSVWVVLVARRVLGRRTVLWGHAWSRSGPGSRTDPLRNVMRRLADVILVYTEAQREELTRRMPGARIDVAPNAIYRRGDMSPRAVAGRGTIVFVGRLVAAKKPALLLEAFRRAVDRGLDPAHRLVFAGDGPERAVLEAALDRRPDLRPVVQLPGHVAPDAVKDLLQEALVTVSPGYVGLSITQSFSFGVPMIVARDEPHSPEIAAAVEGLNAMFVPSDDPDALADALLRVSEDAPAWLGASPRIVAECAAGYSAEAMAAGIIGAVET